MSFPPAPYRRNTFQPSTNEALDHILESIESDVADLMETQECRQLVGLDYDRAWGQRARTYIGAEMNTYRPRFIRLLRDVVEKLHFFSPPSAGDFRHFCDHEDLALRRKGGRVERLLPATMAFLDELAALCKENDPRASVGAFFYVSSVRAALASRLIENAYAECVDLADETYARAIAREGLDRTLSLQNVIRGIAEDDPSAIVHFREGFHRVKRVWPLPIFRQSLDHTRGSPPS